MRQETCDRLTSWARENLDDPVAIIWQGLVCTENAFEDAMHDGGHWAWGKSGRSCSFATLKAAVTKSTDAIGAWILKQPTFKQWEKDNLQPQQAQGE